MGAMDANEAGRLVEEFSHTDRRPECYPSPDGGWMWGWLGPGCNAGDAERWERDWRQYPNGLPAALFAVLPPTTGRAGRAVCWRTRAEAMAALVAAISPYRILLPSAV